MFRTFRKLITTVLALACVVAVPAMLFGQTPADTAAVAPPATTASGLGAFLTTYAIELSTIIGSLLLYAASHLIPAIGNLGNTVLEDWIKRGLLVAGDFIVIEVLHLLGGTVPAALSGAVGSFGGSLVQALAAAIVGGTIFSIGGAAPPKTA